METSCHWNASYTSRTKPADPAVCTREKLSWQPQNTFGLSNCFWQAVFACFSRGAKKICFNDFLFLIFLQILTNAQTLASTRATKTRRAWTNQEATRAPATKDIAETDSHAFVSNSQIPGASGASVFLRRSYWIVVPRNFVSLLGKDWTQRMRAFLGAITHGYLAKPRRDISVFIWSQLLRADFFSCHHWWSLFSKFKW